MGCGPKMLEQTVGSKHRRRRSILACGSDGLCNVALADDGADQMHVIRVGGIDAADCRNEGIQIAIALILLPGCTVRRPPGNQPSIATSGVRERVVVGEFEILDDGLAVYHLARRDCAALRVAISLLDTEIIRVADRLCSPCRFDGPLSDH